MTPKEKFEQVIQMIEERVEQPEYSSQEIAMEVARFSGLQLRDMSTVFSYLLNMTLNSYIMNRKLMASYMFLMNSARMDSVRAVELAGYADQPTFHKAFKRSFNMTPKEAFLQKDRRKFVPIITWDALSGNSISPLNREINDLELMDSTTFGMPESSFNVLNEVLDLESFYGLPRLFSEYAYELSTKTDHSLADCFRYADSLHEYSGDFQWLEGFNRSHEELLREVADDELIQTVFFEKGISVSVLVELRDFYNASLDVLMKCDMNMLKMFPGFEEEYSMQFAYYVRAYEYYAERIPVNDDDDRFNKYLDEVMVGKPIETAFEHVSERDISPDKDYDEYEEKENDQYSSKNFDDRYYSIEELAKEEEMWRGRSIDEDLYYDPDNTAYSDYDDEDDGFHIED